MDTAIDLTADHKVGELIAIQEVVARSLTGTGPEIIEKLEGMEANGIDNVAISVTDSQGARDLLQSL